MAQQSRAVPALNAAIVAAVVILLGAVALVVAPPSPPGIAEYAPQAVAAIKQAPTDQTSQFGKGATGTCRKGVACAKPTPAKKPPTKVPTKLGGPSYDKRTIPSQLSCYRWPDGSVTQTLDPQSPPCVATYDDSKGNGGATSQGVTATAISVVVPGWDPSTQEDKDLLAFFNSHYQFYGRQLRITSAPTGFDAGDPATNQAAASAVVQAKPFAATDVAGNFGDEQPTYRSKVTGAKVVYVGYGTATITSKELAREAPYAWTYRESGDETLRNFGQYICADVAGKNATWSPQTASQKRSFALLRHAPSGRARADTAPLTDALAACGVTPAKTVDFDYADDNTPDSQLQLQMRQLQQAGVTTIIEVGDRGSLYHAFSAANGANYQPEWLAPGLSGTYFDFYGTNQNPAQAQHLVGLATDGKKIPYTSEAWYGALTEADPSYTLPAGGVGGPITLYKTLALLAAGIQTAGPHLTPQSFSSGLTQTVFPDPGAGAPPSYQAGVGFVPGGHTFVRDLGVWWWTATQQSSEAGGASASNPGGMCWVQRGARWGLDGWPRTVAPYSGTCR